MLFYYVLFMYVYNRAGRYIRVVLSRAGSRSSSELSSPSSLSTAFFLLLLCILLITASRSCCADSIENNITGGEEGCVLCLGLVAAHALRCARRRNFEHGVVAWLRAPLYPFTKSLRNEDRVRHQTSELFFVFFQEGRAGGRQ